MSGPLGSARIEPWDGSRLRTVTAQGIDFCCLEAGDGPLALCLHGFPDSPYTWRHLLPALAADGYRAVAPFMRGYAPTSLPGDGSYHLGTLLADTEALFDQLGGDDDAVVIGHDWGALVAYGSIAVDNRPWRAAVGIGVPPGDALTAGFLGYEQLKQSFYLFLCQTPLAGIAFSANDMEMIDGLWRDWETGYDSSADTRWVKASLRHPDHLDAVLGYARAAMNPRSCPPEHLARAAAAAGPADRPFLYLHGSDSTRITVPSARRSVAALGPQASQVTVDGCGHFPHLRRPRFTNGIVLDWLRRQRESRLSAAAASADAKGVGGR